MWRMDQTPNVSIRVWVYQFTRYEDSSLRMKIIALVDVDRREVQIQCRGIRWSTTLLRPRQGTRSTERRSASKRRNLGFELVSNMTCAPMWKISSRR
ncbi:hypothetical protein BKA66DRAFT_463760 [Pyrenochaeta sp. MPI-SDFR-AT-0127]|nr:hypothetical protein BKA66DRAFT_463760 [Pyrenochaeta sp. MPI-SDFR-AT-0127]